MSDQITDALLKKIAQLESRIAHLEACDLPDSSLYVKKAGDTMTGLLTLSGDPTSDLHAATKQYVDSHAGGSGALELITDTPVTSDSTYIDVSSVDLNTSRFFWIIFSVKNGVAAETRYDLYVNGDYTADHYRSQVLKASSTSLNGNRQNNGRIILLSSSDQGMISILMIRDPGGYARARANGCRSQTVDIFDVAWSTASTVTNVTSFRIQATQTGGIGAGSRIVVFGKA